MLHADSQFLSKTVSKAVDTYISESGFEEDPATYNLTMTFASYALPSSLGRTQAFLSSFEKAGVKFAYPHVP